MIMAAVDKKSLKKELLRAGADYIIDNFRQLKPIITSG
jgi:hypothetical protein